MPCVKSIKPYLGKIAENIKAISGVKNVYVFGSLAQNISNPNHRITDIDIIATVPINSEDLTAINQETLGYKVAHLEDDGFNPKAVAFSKSYTNTEIPIDCWVISSDKKLLHWGPIASNESDQRSIIKEAEYLASIDTGIMDLKKTSEDDRNNWFLRYGRRRTIGHPFWQSPCGL
jgi:predicted nucleotidyltransferase